MVVEAVQLCTFFIQLESHGIPKKLPWKVIEKSWNLILDICGNLVEMFGQTEIKFIFLCIFNEFLVIYNNR